MTDNGRPSLTRIRALIQDVLAVPDLAPDDDLFDSGLDSFTAIELAARIEDEVGFRCEPDVFFLHPTAADLAEHLGASTPDG